MKNIKQLLLKRTILSIFLLSIIFVGLAESYILFFIIKNEQEKLNTSLHSFSTGILKHLNYGDIWSIKSIAKTGLKSGIFNKLTIHHIDRENKKREVLKIPFIPSNMEPEFKGLKSEYTIQSKNGFDQWQVAIFLMKRSYFNHILMIRISIYLTIILLILIFVILNKYILKIFLNEITEINHFIHKIDYKTNLKDETINVSTIEGKISIEKLRETNSKLLDFIELEKSTTKEKATYLVAGQVIHDIRSPLSAMDMVMRDLDILPESTRLILRSSIQRIQDIANNLSTKKKNNQSLVNQNKLSIQLLSACIEEIVSEKRLHFRPLLNVTIERSLDKSYGLFAKINIVEFKRVLSNLINNAVEAFDDGKGLVTIHLKKQNPPRENKIQIIIEDNGIGIPSHIISKLGKRGASFGKENNENSGSGLGLHHAKNTVELWGGSFEIESIVDMGTKMILTLPQAQDPSWFVSEVKIDRESAIVILDDDQGIHHTWSQKLKKHDINDKQIFHLCSPDDFSKWIKEKSSLFEKILYLCDFELIGFSKTGLDLIEEFSVGKNSILVSSHYEEDKIQKRCEQSGVLLIPKMIVAHVPISVTPHLDLIGPTFPKKKIETKVVLLDDDNLTRMVWKSTAKEKKINLKVFEFPADLYRSLDKISKDTIFYIDSSLSDGQKGEDVALNLFNKGHKNLYLATGYEPEAFENLSYLKGIIGKSPPW